VVERDPTSMHISLCNNMDNSNCPDIYQAAINEFVNKYKYLNDLQVCQLELEIFIIKFPEFAR
jgi:hypothetical protein